MTSNEVAGYIRNTISSGERAAVLATGFLRLAACAGQPPGASATPSSKIQPTREPCSAPRPDPSTALTGRDSGPDAHTHDPGTGPNTYCSRCHSTQNWDPATTVDLLPKCVKCIFPTDPELRIATEMAFVEEEDWVGIDCATSHPVERDVALPGRAWLITATGQCKAVNIPDEPCAKCHLTTAGFSASGWLGVTHAVDAGSSAHANWAGEWPQADRPQYCTDCHDPHSAEPLQCLDWHPEIPASSTYMSGMNAFLLDKIECMTCHDAFGLDVGPNPDPEQNGSSSRWPAQRGGMVRRRPATNAPTASSGRSCATAATFPETSGACRLFLLRESR
jgi:hypothetical protein